MKPKDNNQKVSKGVWNIKQTPPAYSALEKTACITATVLLLNKSSAVWLLVYTWEREASVTTGQQDTSVSLAPKALRAKATNNTLLLKLSGPHEEIAPLQLSIDLLTILLPSKILTWCWSTLGIAGFFFEVAIRHQNKVEPLSLLEVLCVTLERNVGIGHPVVLMGTTQRHLNVILQIYLAPEHGTKHLVLLFHCPSSVVEKKSLRCVFKTPGGFYTL